MPSTAFLPGNDIMVAWIHAYLECRAEIRGIPHDEVTKSQTDTYLEQVEVWRVVRDKYSMSKFTHFSLNFIHFTTISHGYK